VPDRVIEKRKAPQTRPTNEKVLRRDRRVSFPGQYPGYENSFFTFIWFLLCLIKLADNIAYIIPD
jgi:hypothetical protein